MTTLRQAHKKRYTCIDNSLAQNNELSLRCRGMMLYLLSLPDDWKIHLKHLCKIMKEGKKSIIAILAELKSAGYIHHHKMGFKEGWQYFVFESPITDAEFKKFLRTSPFLEEFQKANYSKKEPLQSNKKQTEKKITKNKKPFPLKRGKSDPSEEGTPAVPKNRRANGTNLRALGKSPRQVGNNPMQKRRDWAIDIAEKQPGNYYYCQEKDTLYYTSGAIQTGYPINKQSVIWEQIKSREVRNALEAVG